MQYLNIFEVFQIYQDIMQRTGGAPGLRDRGALESALAQPQMSFAGQEFYPTLGEKAAALCYSLVLNHPFIDGNKRIGYFAMVRFLALNGYNLSANVDEQEAVILKLAAGEMPREEFFEWVSTHLVERPNPS